MVVNSIKDFLSSLIVLKVHSYILIICSIIGFTGHYMQYDIARLTPWIPAMVGAMLLMLNEKSENHELMKHIPTLIILAFGILTTVMCLRFLFQDLQPIRKKIIFSVMSISAYIFIYLEIKKLLTTAKERN